MKQTQKHRKHSEKKTTTCFDICRRLGFFKHFFFLKYISVTILPRWIFLSLSFLVFFSYFLRENCQKVERKRDNKFAFKKWQGDEFFKIDDLNNERRKNKKQKNTRRKIFELIYIINITTNKNINEHNKNLTTQFD